jgi:hypothetical protein
LTQVETLKIIAIFKYFFENCYWFKVNCQHNAVFGSLTMD